MKKLRSRQAKKYPGIHVSFHQREKEKWRIAGISSLRGLTFAICKQLSRSHVAAWERPFAFTQSACFIHSSSLPVAMNQTTFYVVLGNSMGFTDYCWLSLAFTPFDFFNTSRCPALRPRGSKNDAEPNPALPEPVLEGGVGQTLSYGISACTTFIPFQPLCFIV